MNYEPRLCFYLIIILNILLLKFSLSVKFLLIHYEREVCIFFLYFLIFVYISYTFRVFYMISLFRVVYTKSTRKIHEIVRVLFVSFRVYTKSFVSCSFWVTSTRNNFVSFLVLTLSTRKHESTRHESTRHDTIARSNSILIDKRLIIIHEHYIASLS